jgi:type IV pilus assembly protein PilO
LNIREAKTQRSILIALFVAGAYYAYFGLSAVPFGYRPKADKIKVLKEEYAQLSNELTQARRLAADLPRVEDVYRKTHARWETAHELLPIDQEIPGLLRKMTLVGETAGVDFHLFEPKAPVNRQFYYENAVDVSVVGGYHEVGAFFGEIASLPRLVNVSDLRLAIPYDLKIQVKGDKPRIKLVDIEEDDTVVASFTATAYSVTAANMSPDVPDSKSNADRRAPSPAAEPSGE